MTRMLILATFSLAATTLQLLAQTPNGPVQAQCKGQSKAPQWLARAWSRAPVKLVRVLRRDLPAQREVLVRPLSELREARALWRPRLAEVLGAL